MQSTPPSNDTSLNRPVDNSAFARLASLPAGTDKDTLISTIDGAVDQIVAELTNHERGPLPSDILLKVKTSLSFLEQCLAFKDEQFTAFARKRANEVQHALSNTITRIQEAQKPAKAKEEKIETPAPEPIKEAPVEKEAEAFDPKAFLYPREEKILIDYAFDRLSKRLAFLRGDTVKVEKGKAVPVSGIHDDGVAPFFLIAPDFPRYLRPAFEDLIRGKRDLLARRIYIHTDKNDSDDDVRTLYGETYHRDIDGIVALAFDDWAGELAKSGVEGAGLPQEKRVIGAKKKEDDTKGLGSSLKKVFSFGAKKDEDTKIKTKKPDLPDSPPIRIHKEWQSLENQGVFSLSQHFSYSLISYAMQLSEGQFETEYQCIAQIVDQQDEPDVGPVVTNLSRLYKFYDNIFFDLVIVVLFHRKNAFDINMLQAACMSQNFVVERLPLTMDELRRRPMEHAKRILRVLKEGEDKETVKQAIKDYFHVHETIHASKVGKRIQASENLLKRQAGKLEGPQQQVIKEILEIFIEVNTLKQRQKEDSIFLGEEILEAVALGIERAITPLS